MRKTNKGRIVYDRPPNIFTLADVARVAAKCQSWYVKPEKRVETILRLSFFMRRLIQELTVVEVDELTKEAIGREASNVLQAFFRWMSDQGEKLWGILYSALVEFFRPKKK